MKNPLENLPGYVLRRASSATLDDLARRLDVFGLRPTDASILVLIGANPGITQSDLCRMLGMQRANMTPLVGKLSERKLIDREAVNGRSQGLRLTAAGTRLSETAFEAMRNHEAELSSGIRAEQRLYLMPMLKALWGMSSRPH